MYDRNLEDPQTWRSKLQIAGSGLRYKDGVNSSMYLSGIYRNQSVTSEESNTNTMLRLDTKKNGPQNPYIASENKVSGP